MTLHTPIWVKLIAGKVTFVSMTTLPGTELNDKYLRLIGIPVSIFAILLLQMPIYFPGRWDLFWRYVGISILFTTLVWEISRAVVIKTRQRFPGFEQTTYRIVSQLVLFIVQLAIMQFLLTRVVYLTGWTETKEPFWKVWLINFSSSLFFILIITGIYEALYFFKQYKYTIEKTEALKKQQALQNIEALKTRVNPHFLFNSLTTLSALIGEDRPKAERFVDELSKVYRYLLRSARYHIMTLDEELDFAKSYSFLLENRFGSNEFKLCLKQKDVDVLVKKDHSLPSLTFQYAIDYIVRTQHVPLCIDIVVFDHHIHFLCDYNPKALAINALQNDWRHLESHGASKEYNGNKLVIHIPLIKAT